MKRDPGTNYTIADGLVALSRSADTYYTSPIVDHALAPAAAFNVSCGTWASSFVATLQNSEASGSGWGDEADTTAGNTVSLTFTEADEGVIKVPNPRKRYSRVKVVIGGTCVFSVTNISGPLRAVDQG